MHSQNNQKAIALVLELVLNTDLEHSIENATVVANRLYPKLTPNARYNLAKIAIAIVEGKSKYIALAFPKRQKVEDTKPLLPKFKVYEDIAFKFAEGKSVKSLAYIMQAHEVNYTDMEEYLTVRGLWSEPMQVLKHWPYLLR